ncbi:MAG: carbohydrate kinase family protein [Victivallaceae bacterium]|nr:carbohydrate kinase family protein [Victivallaceae bacterium]
MYDAIVIGHLLKETILYRDGRKLGPVLGSPCAYTAMAAASLGLKTGVVSKTGYDMGRHVMAMKKAGLDVSGIALGEHSTENYLDYTVPEGKKLSFIHKAELLASLEDFPADYLDARYFLLCPVDYEITDDLLRALYDGGKRKLSMELSGFGGASSAAGIFTQMEKEIYLERITRHFRIVKGGLEDCRCIFGEVKLADAEDLCKIFVNWGAEICVLTLGKHGAAAYSKKTGFVKVPAPDCAVRDLTGAGDVFHAGFIAGCLEKNDIRAGLETGSAASAAIIARTGGVTPSRFRELRKTSINFSEADNS